MISIGKLRSADAAVEYLQHAVADSALDYYHLSGESPGRWSGAAAPFLGLNGEVTADQLRAVLSGVHPMTGQPLGRKWWSSTNVAFDVTFSAPKSVSLLYAIGDETVRRAVLDAHEAGVDAALAYLQRHAGWARQYNRMTGKVEPVRADMVMPRFLHRTARPVSTLGPGAPREIAAAGGGDPQIAEAGSGFVGSGSGFPGEVVIDPQLHTHVPIPTWVCRPDGSWSALLSEPLYQHAATAGAVGQAAMRQVLIDRLGVEVEVMPNGTFEIAGITEAQRREFSRRRQQIEAAEALYGIEGIEGRETANLATREAKKEAGVGPELWQRWRERAAAVGLDEASVRTLCGRRGPARQFQLSPELVHLIVGDQGLTAEAATFSRREVVRSIAALATDGMGVDQLERIADAVLTDATNVVTLGPRLVDVRRDDDHETSHVFLEEHRFSTPEMVALEQQMLATAVARRGVAAARTTDEAVQAAVRARPTLSTEQRRMIDAVCVGSDGVVLIEGVAGAGKTYALDACREAFESSGHRVIGYALAGRAAQTLEEEAAIPSHTIARAIPALMEQRLAPGTVVVVDEAGMVGSRQLAQLVALTARDGAKLVLCGDPHQLQPIDGGAGFRALVDHLGAVQLTHSLRQREVWEREALAMVRGGAIAGAVEAYQEHQRVRVAATAMERRRQVVAAALEATAAGRDTVVLTRTRDEATAVNELSRAVWRATGRLVGEEVVVGGRPFQVGDQVVCERNSPHGIRTRAPGSPLPASATSSGTPLPPEVAAPPQFRGVPQKPNSDVAPRIQLTNGLRGEVLAVDRQRCMVTIRTAQGDIAIDGNRYPHLNHAYALTAHKAQGITADVALVVGSEAASNEWAYSVLSRARMETRYFTVERPVADLHDIRHSRPLELTLAQRLVRAWSPSEAKDSSLDYGPARAVDPGLSVISRPDRPVSR